MNQHLRKRLKALDRQIRLLRVWSEACEKLETRNFSESEALFKTVLREAKTLALKNFSIGAVLLDLARLYDAQGKPARAAHTRARVFRLAARESESRARLYRRMAGKEVSAARKHSARRSNH